MAENIEYYDIKDLYNECYDSCKRLGIPVSDNIKYVRVSGKMTKTFGTTAKHTYGSNVFYEIAISKKILDKRISVDVARNTIFHELCHTCPGCMNHGPDFLRYGRVIERETGLKIQRYVGTEESKEVSQFYKTAQDYKYFIYKDGKLIAKYKAKGKVVKQLEKNRDYFFEAYGYELKYGRI